MRRMTSAGRNLATCLLLVLPLTLAPTGCTSTGFLVDGMKTGNSLAPGGRPGTSEGNPSDAPNQAAFIGLYQTAVGPLLLKAGRLFSLDSGELRDWGAAPRTGMAWSLVMTSAQEGWSVGEEGIAHYRNQIWEPVVSGSDDRLAGANGKAIQLTDVSFANSVRGYAVGTHGAVLAYENEVWTRLVDTTFEGKHFGTVRAVATDDVWVAGEDVLHFDGSNWESIGLPDAGAPVSGLVVLEDEVWTSSGDAVWRWDRLQRTWSKPQADLVMGTMGSPQAVPGPAGSVRAWALDVGTAGGTLYRLTSGVWERTTMQAPPDVALDSLALLDADTGYALSYDGVAAYAFDKGSWTRLKD